MAPPLSRFLTAYHITHACVLLGYPVLASRWLKRAFPENAGALWTWEKQVAVTTVAVVGLKFLKRDNLDSWVVEALRFSEASILALAYVADPYPHGRVLAWGVVFAILAYVYVVPEKYDVSKHASVARVTPAAIRSEIKKTEWTKVDSKIKHVVLAHADWSESSNHVLPHFCDIADAFHSNETRFYLIDVGRFPETAEKTLGVPLDASFGPSAVPSVLLFQKGEELARVPRAYLDGTKVKGSRLRRLDIIKGLGLEESGDGRGDEKKNGGVAKGASSSKKKD